MAEITLGSQVIDRITGIKGTAIGRTVWLNGCIRISIQPKGEKDGKAFEAHGADEQDVEVLKPAKRISSPSGGPHPNPQRRTDVSR